MKIWTLVIDHKHGITPSTHLSEAEAKQALWNWCDDWWEQELRGRERPANEGDLISEYFEHVEDEIANIEPCEVELDLADLKLVLQVAGYFPDRLRSELEIAAIERIKAVVELQEKEAT